LPKDSFDVIGVEADESPSAAFLSTLFSLLKPSGHLSLITGASADAVKALMYAGFTDTQVNQHGSTVQVRVDVVART